MSERSLREQVQRFRIGYVQGRQNILISGGTGCGKTTLLNALAKFIADEDRILLIEDTSEIQLEKPNLVRFEARQAQPALPAITIRDLLKASLSLYSATTLKKKSFSPDSAAVCRDIASPALAIRQ